MRLLVGLDQRQGGRDALELARVLGLCEPSSALVALVLDTGLYPLEYALLTEEEAKDVAPLFDEARAALTGIEVETRAYGSGSPGRILDDLLHEGGFDVVVVGSSHRGPVGRVLVGSAAASLLSGSPAAVAVAPVGYGNEVHPPLRTVAVGFDGTDESHAALDRAAAIAGAAGAALDVVTVVKPPTAVPSMVPVITPQTPAMPERVIDEGLGAVAAEVRAEGVRLDGDPAGELIRRCEQGVDLLVLGSRGYGPVMRVLLGSVSRRVASHAPCPTIVVPRP